MRRWGAALGALAGLGLAAGAYAADNVPPPASPAASATAAAPAGPAGAPAQPAGAAPPDAPAPPKPPVSVMFTPGDLQAIAQAYADHEHPSAALLAAQAQATAAVEALQPHIPNIYVSAILDFGGGDWTVWANGLRVTPDEQSPLFRVISVRGNTVEISVTSDGGTRITLQPYQTWRSRQKDVVEGIFP